MFWNTVLGVNSFILWPITSVFLVYSIAAAFLVGLWDQLGVALLLFGASVLTQMVLGVLSE